MDIYVYGASGHGSVVAFIARACGYYVKGFIDDAKVGEWDNEPIIPFHNLPAQSMIALGIGANTTREKVAKKCEEAGHKLIILIHPSSIVAPNATIREGSVVMPCAVIHPHAQIGKGVIVNTHSIVEHECCISDYVHLSPNVALAGAVTVGQYTHIGIGACVIQNIEIGSHCLIGAGSVVVRNVADFIKTYGNPAKERQ